MKILSASVVIRSGYGDDISLTTDIPSPLPCDEGTDRPLFLSFFCARNGGVEYVRKHFDIEPRIIIVS